MKRIAPMDAFAESSSGAGTAEAAYPSLAQRPRLLLPTPTLARLPSRGLNRGDPVPSIPMGLPSVAGITSLFGQSSSSATGTRPFEEELAGFVPRTAIAPAASTPQWRQPEYYRELMALLDEYQDGVPTHQLQAKFPGQISRYLSDTGQIMSKGWEFRTALRNADKSRFDQAVDRRLELWKLSQPHSKAKLGTESPITEFYCTYERIFSRLELILDAYATGATMQGLQKSCAPVNLKSYLTNNGLSKVAGDFLLALLDRDQQAKLLKAIEDRQAIQRIASRFVAATRAFADPSRPMERVARKVKVDVADLRRFLTETGLTERGRAYVSACDAPTRQLIEANLALRRDAVRTATEGRAFAELDRRLGPGNASRTEPEDAGSRLGLTEDVDIKQEIPAPAGPSTRTVLVEREIDQARTAFHEELAEICDLTEDLTTNSRCAIRPIRSAVRTPVMSATMANAIPTYS